ncbi:hypothetical protein CPLU01_01818 [Colletotrichum plurivorum]|uniref:Uncharacterized protein n=1 Tax=Colletotrichum plurivorum TaxID=2175906 RepID=A0A8H6KY34_9PEZI|nr:hypothetical protein CPLU01_01818 [Colletotrichum plurivorum]
MDNEVFSFHPHTLTPGRDVFGYPPLGLSPAGLTRDPRCSRGWGADRFDISNKRSQDSSQLSVSVITPTFCWSDPNGGGPRLRAPLPLCPQLEGGGASARRKAAAEREGRPAGGVALHINMVRKLEKDRRRPPPRTWEGIIGAPPPPPPGTNQGGPDRRIRVDGGLEHSQRDKT